jgi:hypothetical protein
MAFQGTGSSGDWLNFKHSFGLKSQWQHHFCIEQFLLLVKALLDVSSDLNIAKEELILLHTRMVFIDVHHLL